MSPEFLSYPLGYSQHQTFLILGILLREFLSASMFCGQTRPYKTICCLLEPHYQTVQVTQCLVSSQAFLPEMANTNEIDFGLTNDLFPSPSHYPHPHFFVVGLLAMVPWKFHNFFFLSSSKSWSCSQHFCVSYYESAHLFPLPLCPVREHHLWFLWDRDLSGVLLVLYFQSTAHGLENVWILRLRLCQE